LIKKILPFIIILLQISLTAQVSTSYSRYGIGDVEYSYSARKLGMGHLGTAVSDINYINGINPAGWNRINRTRIELNLDYKGINFSSGGDSHSNSDIDFSGFTIAFPVSGDYGISFAAGLLPYSRVDYNVVEEYNSTTAGDYRILYTGSGGLSKLFAGSSYTLPFDLSIGATLDYYFGNLNYSSRVEFGNTANIPAEYIRTYSPKGVGSTVGLISPDFSNTFGFKNVSDLRLGVSANIFSELATDTVLSSFRDPRTDTIAGAVITSKIPVRIYTGLSFVIDKQYLLTFDYAFQQWENYLFNNISAAELRNAFKISAGFEYSPAREIGSSFWEQIILRGGLSFEETQYTFNGTGINQYSVSTGLSLPLAAGNTIDIGILYGIRGKDEPGLIKENIIRLSLGISLGDIWFIRQEK
jgi:hypothetical protein